MYALLRYLPKNHLSFLLGSLASIPLPPPLRLLSLRIFAKLARIDMGEAAQPLSEYRTISDLFVRKLRSGVRPVGSGVVSPVDGTLRGCGVIRNGRLPQVKDRTYSVGELIGDSEMAKHFENGYFFNLYLSPQDYHRVHSPCDGEIEWRRYIPGKLWPVNDWSLSNIDNLFAINERVVIAIHSTYGRLLLVMIGATNVGKISLSFDPLITNRVFDRTASGNYVRQLAPAIQIHAGDELGMFHLGSSVVLLFEPQAGLDKLSCPQGGKVKMGQQFY